ncbi:hypothetical protein BOS5A_180080 [Bosea sp. EC-HK365B]|nr:hypothetical protein BOSE21B_80081 [Bosea sp. 21B]CAD5300048.1 hypothetical protein BOSE7B_60728 [Bosea sp. 7B]VVT57153.1 hypothetical protein BOS5A_180080 [Bosea sp. EC-HK365B]VXB50061.1 hypothetical protein BOSE127_120192 [Bosea sp. 127]VXC83721.1 hypothetical protein BOSE125_500003 [Bosea sp. 125]
MRRTELSREVLGDKQDFRRSRAGAEIVSQEFALCASGMVARMGEDPPAGLPRSRQPGPEGETPNPVVGSVALRKPSRSRSNERL